MSAASPRLADLVRLGMPALAERCGHRLTAHQRNALQAIANCRTEAFGATAMRCGDCGHISQRLRSCGHRSCPQCHHHSASAWLAAAKRRSNESTNPTKPHAPPPTPHRTVFQ